MQDCIFCKIIKKEIPSYIVYEDEEFISFVDIFPMKKGHILVVPKICVNKVYDLDDQIYQKLFTLGKKLAIKMEKVLIEKLPELEVKRIGYAIEGFGVPHTHLHLVPLAKGNDMNPEKTYKAEKEELEEIHKLYKSVFN